MKKIMTFFLMLVCFFPAIVKAQSSTTPKIMVIPYVKQGEDIRTVLEKDPNKRIVLTKIKEAFDANGVNTIDFVAKLKANSQAAAFQEDSQTDLKSQIVQSSGADIYVEAEIIPTYGSGTNAVKIIMTAFECSSAQSLANKVAESGSFATNDFGALASRAIVKVSKDFMDVIQSKFDQIVAEGKTVVVKLSFSNDSPYTTASELASGNALCDELELWMDENAFKGNYHIQGTTEKVMEFDDVRLPYYEPNGRLYKNVKFKMALQKFFKDNGIDVGVDVNGSTFWVTVK